MKKRTHTPFPWLLKEVGRKEISLFVAALSLMDKAFILFSKGDGDESLIVAIFPTNTKKPTQEDMGNQRVIAEAFRVLGLTSKHPEEWGVFLEAIKSKDGGVEE